MATQYSAEYIIQTLNLKPNPEKGYYTETFRDPNSSEPQPNNRPISTCIYYLLEGKDASSRWHRLLDSSEIWHFYAGAPLQLSLSWDNGQPTRKMILGIELEKGQRPQAIVSRGEWQCAQSLGEWSLVGTTVAPGFTFESFEMAPVGWEPR